MADAGMTSDWTNVSMDELPRCVDACERAYYYADPLFDDGRGQWNCPLHFGVDYMYTVNPMTRKPCRRWKRKR